MTIDDLKHWLLNKFILCYPVVKEEYHYQIYWYYDESYIRKIKLLNLNNINNISNYTLQLNHKINGDCLFIQDIKNKFIWYDNKYILNFLKSNYNDDFIELTDLINNTLNDIPIFNNYNYFGYFEHNVNCKLLSDIFEELIVIDYPKQKK